MRYVCLFYFVLGSIVSFGQSLRIDYEVGFDCRSEKFGGQHGACSLHQTLMYKFDTISGNYRAFKFIEYKSFRIWERGGFGMNLEKDSVRIITLGKVMQSEQFDELVGLMRELDDSIPDGSILLKGVRYKSLRANLKIFNVSEDDISKLEKSLVDRDMSEEDLLTTVSKKLLDVGQCGVLSSVVENLKVTVDNRKEIFVLTQDSPGGLNVTWQLQEDKFPNCYLIPGLNSLISEWLPKRMRVRRKLKLYSRGNRMIALLNELESAHNSLDHHHE